MDPAAVSDIDDINRCVQFARFFRRYVCMNTYDGLCPAQVFEALRVVEDGALDANQLFAGCAACGFLLNERQKAEILKTLDTNAQGLILFHSFLAKYCCNS